MATRDVGNDAFIAICREASKKLCKHRAGGAKRPVICVETGELFESVAAAARAVGVSSSNISQSCRTPIARKKCILYAQAGKCVRHFQYQDIRNTQATDVWKAIPFTYGLFEVSDKGHVRNTITGTILRLHKRCRHLFAELCVDSSRSAFEVGRLVAESFLPDHDPDACVVHIDGDINNNCLNNLQWCSWKEMLNRPAVREKKRTAYYTSERCKAFRASKRFLDLQHALIEKGKARSKRVVCEETGVVYESIAAAARSFGISCASVSGSCKAARRGNIHKVMYCMKGKVVHHFRYADEQ